MGIQALVLCKIWKRPSPGGSDAGLGTLCYFFSRPHHFSRRDLDLFRAYCHRVADYLQILDSLQQERASGAIRDVQARQLTYVEVANLLAHDLWHKSFNTEASAKEHVELVNGSVAKGKIRGAEPALEELTQSAVNLHTAASEMYATCHKLRAIQTGSKDEIYKSSLFTIVEVLDAIEGTLKPAMGRNKITLKRAGPSDVRIEGPRVLFEQVIFNLVINSIDAARARAKARPMEISISWHTQQDHLIIRYQDNGPGIDQRTFPDVNEIFKIGRTSKPMGTGTGLPIARRLIGTYFSGQLILTEPHPALFTIDIPLRH